MWPTVFIVCTAAAVFLIVALAHSHGLAGWIESNPETNWCCSAGDDCLPQRAENVVYTADGWTVRGLDGTIAETQKGLYRGTPDGRPWACRYPGTRTLRCLFLNEIRG